MASRERVSVLGQRCTDSERGAHATTFRRSLWARPVVEAILASTSDRLVFVQASARRTGAQQSVAPHPGRSQMRWGGTRVAVTRARLDHRIATRGPHPDAAGTSLTTTDFDVGVPDSSATEFIGIKTLASG